MASTAINVLVRVEYSLDGGKTWAIAPASGIDVPWPDSTPAAGGPPTAVTTTIGATSVALKWADPETGAPFQYLYGHDGGGVAAAAWEGSLPPTVHAATLDKLTPGQTYVVHVTAVAPLGAKYTSTQSVAIPPAPTDPPVVTPPGGARVALVGKSGLPYNSIRFAGGAPSLADLRTGALARGRAYDGALNFLPRNSWDAFRTGWGDTKAMLAAGLLVVTSLPHAPESEGVAMNGKGANDAYAAEQRSFGAWLKSSGLDVVNHVLRVDWEFNGNWYKWSAANAGLKLALQHFVTNVRAGGAVNVRFDLCANQPSVTGKTWADVFPGPEFIDVIGIDQYDQFPPSFTQATWDSKQAQTLSMTGAAKFAASQGIQWSLDEGGNTHGTGPDYGGDNPLYWRFLAATLNALSRNAAWWNTYDQAGTGGLNHTLANNPKSLMEYRRLFGA